MSLPARSETQFGTPHHFLMTSSETEDARNGVRLITQASIDCSTVSNVQHLLCWHCSEGVPFGKSVQTFQCDFCDRAACLQHPSVCGYDETEALRSQECLVSCRSHVPVVEATDRRNGEEPVSACKRLERLLEGNPDKALWKPTWNGAGACCRRHFLVFHVSISLEIPDRCIEASPPSLF